MILGHGFEEDIAFKDRDIMPPGYTLVALTDFGTPAILSENCAFMKAFADPSNLSIFEDPRTNKEWLSKLLGNRSIRIYEPGAAYPKLYASMVSQFKFNSTEMTYGISGVYDFPLPLKTLRAGTEPCEENFDKVKIKQNYNFIENEADIPRFINNAYGESLLPTKDQVTAIFDRDKKTKLTYEFDPNSLDKLLTMSIKDIMAAQGPGIYYHVICRSIKKTASIDTFEELIKQIAEAIDQNFPHEEIASANGTSFSNPRANKYKEFLGIEGKQKWGSHINDVITYLKTDKRTVERMGYNDPKLDDLLSKLEALKRKGRLTRVESQLQQRLANTRSFRRARRSKKNRLNTRRRRR